jgi:hypothetical protein
MRIASTLTRYDIRKTQYKLRYPFIGELTGLVKEQYSIYVRHQLRLIDAKDTLVPSTAFGSGLSELFRGTTQRQKSQNTKNNSQNHLTNRNTFHHFFLLEARQAGFLIDHLGENPSIFIFIISAARPPVNAKNAGLATPSHTIQKQALFPSCLWWAEMPS